MKIIKYDFCTRVNRGTHEKPKWENVLSPVTMGWNEINEEIAKAEAYNGVYTIEDDGAEEPEFLPAEMRITELEEALEMLLNGVTE